jgi:hypothetical protein
VERRQYQRIKTCNLISFVGINSDGKIVEQNMGRALNISQGGIFLETIDMVFSESVSMMSVDSGSNLIEINGEVIYSTVYGKGRFGTGVRFQGTHAQNIQFAMKLIKAYHANKYQSVPAAHP